MTTLQWLAPSPLWDELSAATNKVPLRRPGLLRFATDTFMEDLQNVLSKATPSLRDYVAQPESWSAPLAGLPPVGTTRSATLPLKLYQPVHQRFYLVAATLTCQVPGLPDHTIQRAKGERVAFVLRRLAPLTKSSDINDPAQRTEHAWLAEKKGWAPVSGTAIIDGEEQLALFPMQFRTNGSMRRLFAGLIPVSNRQSYAAGRALTAKAAPAPPNGGTTTGTTPDDPRLIDFQRKVLDPWVDLRDWFDRTVVPAGEQSKTDVIAGADQGSALVLLDFANFLNDYVSDLWTAISSGVAPAPGLKRDLYDALGATMTREDGGGAITVRQAIVKAKAAESALEGATLVVPPTLPAGYVRVSLTDSNPVLRTLIDRDANGDRPLYKKMAAVIAALPATTTGAAAAGTTRTPRVPAKDPASPQGNDWFVVRCAYVRPQCTCCGTSVVLSDPSEAFQLASFFDPDAPARAIHVALPIDTTPAALRKYDKGVAFMISDELAKQMNRVQGLKKLMEGEVGGPGIGIGFICSLSIPIITICAFIVLLIFLYLLNIIFWWIPFFKICFPIPVLKAKGS